MSCLQLYILLKDMLRKTKESSIYERADRKVVKSLPFQLSPVLVFAFKLLNDMTVTFSLIYSQSNHKSLQ